MAPISRTGSSPQPRPSTPSRTATVARSASVARASSPARTASAPRTTSLARTLGLSSARPSQAASGSAFVSGVKAQAVAKTSAVQADGVTETQVLDALRAGKTDDATRTMIADHFKTQDMAGSHATMEKIRSEGLLDTFIQASVRDSDGNPPGAELTAGLTRCMETGRLDVYAETLATTAINVGDYEGKLEYRPGDNAVVLDQNSLGDTQNLANILAHELFHAFADDHGGGYGAINEGFGIAAREYAFQDGDYNLAEMVYGTKNFYRDFNGQPDYPIGDMQNADPKLTEFLTAMAGRDSSQLAWDKPEQLNREYDVYFRPINRNQDWNTWLAAVDDATRRMQDARGKPMQQILDWIRSRFE